MKRILLVSIIVLLAIGPYAQEKDTVQVEPQIKLELVWEKEFESPISDFTLNIAKDDKSYPNVVVLGSKVVILDDKGKKSIEIKGLEGGSDFFSISESGNHIIHSRWHHDKDGKEVEECIVHIYDLTGKLLWKTPNIAPARYPKLSPNGEYLVGTSWAEILLVKKDGTSKFINPRQNKRRMLMRIFFSISGNSEFWGISFGEPYADESVQVITYTPDGGEIWRKVTEPMGLAYELEISNNGEMLGVVSPEKGKNFFYLFNRKGNLLWRAGEISRTNHRIVFSPSDNYVLVADFGGDFKLFDTSSGKEIWHHHIAKGTEKIDVDQDPGIGFIPYMEITISDDENFVIVGGRNSKTNANCLLAFDRRRGIVNTFSIPSSNGGYLPKTKFAPAGDYLYVANGDKLLKYAVRRGK